VVIKLLLLLDVSDCLYYFYTLTSVLGRVFYCKGNLTVLRRYFLLRSSQGKSKENALRIPS
jgi:hypothetical protein